MTQMAADLAPTTHAPDAAGSARSTTAPLRVVLWGTYDDSKPRTRILREGLVQAGVEVTEIHADIWSADRDKSQLGRMQMVFRLVQMLFVYPRLIIAYLRCPAHDLVLLPYLGQFDVIVLWPFAKLRGVPMVLDMFLSLYDTVVNDRRMLATRSLPARLLKWMERLSCRAADRVFLDTDTHAQRIAGLLEAAPDRFDAVPVGAELDVFATVPPRRSHEGPVRILFYGQLIPLHGIETILGAALSPEGRRFEWHIIGSGQDAHRIEAALAETDSHHIHWDRWVPYADLARAIASADLCLGIFGTSDKAASVVPNKVYQCLFAGRPVITRNSLAMQEMFPEPGDALRLVPADDPDALLHAIAELEAKGFPAMPAQLLRKAEPTRIAETLRDKIAPLAQRN